MSVGQTGLLRQELERQCREIAEAIQHLMPPGAGFALLLFDMGEEGNMAYVSDARREDMLKALRELLQVLGAN